MESNILEFNKKCVKFLGYDLNRIVDEMPVRKDGNYCTGNGDFDKDGNQCFLIFSGSIYKFHYDWNHLMNVAMKMEDLGHKFKSVKRTYLIEEIDKFLTEYLTK